MTLQNRLEQLANRTPPREPAEVLAVARARVEAQRTRGRRRPVLAAAALVAVLALVAGGLALFVRDSEESVTVAGPDGGDGADGDPNVAPDTLPSGCLQAELLERPEGLGGAPVTDVLPGGMRASFELGALAARPITGPELEGKWYAVSTVVTDAGGRVLGVPVWVMPDAIVAIAGGVRHLYAADDLAQHVSTWRPPAVSIDPQELEHARACVDDHRGLAFVTGELADGRSWVVTRDPQRGLCVVLRSQDIGCDDSGPVLPQGAPPEIPRIAVDKVPADFAEDEAGELAYAELPDRAVTVTLTYPDGTNDDAAVIDLETKLWGTPVASGNLPETVTYRAQDGAIVGTFTVYK